LRQQERLLLCPLIEVFVRSRIGNLPHAAESRGRGRKQDQKFERSWINRAPEILQAVNLRLVHQVKLSVGLINDPPVGENTRAVNQPTHRTKLPLNAGYHRFNRGTVTHVNRVIDDRRAGGLDPI
jgi:hypothetical protein